MAVSNESIEKKKKQNAISKEAMLAGTEPASGNKKENTADFVSEAQEEDDLSDLFEDEDESVSAGESGSVDNTAKCSGSALAGEQKEKPKKASFLFEVTTCEVTGSPVGKETVFSVVHTEKCGSRVAISRKLVLDKLGIEDAVQVAYSREMNAVILGTDLGGTTYFLKKMHGKGIIYNKSLVLYLEKAFQLDFTNQSTHSFYEVEIIDHEDCGMVAVVRKGE